MGSARRTGWFKERRQTWIGEMLRTYGFINREHLERKFEISTSLATSDLRTYIRLHAAEIHYNKSRKRWESTRYPPVD